MKKFIFVFSALFVCVLLSIFFAAAQNLQTHLVEQPLTKAICGQEEFVNKIDAATDDDIINSSGGAGLASIVNPEEIDEFQSRRIFVKLKDVSYLKDNDLNMIFAEAIDIAVNGEGLIFAEFKTPTAAKTAYNAVVNNSMVKYAQPDSLMPVTLDSNYTWGTESCNFDGFIRDNPAFSNIENEVSVAVIDTGLNVQDTVFSGRIVYDETASEPSDPFGHGTHVAGIVAATTRSLGNKIKICPYKLEAAINEKGQTVFTNTSEMYTIIYKAAKHDVVNMSIGMTNLSLRPLIKESILTSTDTVFVVSAGNDGVAVEEDSLADVVSGMPNGIVVTAIDSNGTPASFSSYASGSSGSFIAAPGVGVWSTYYVGGVTHAPLDGTSMSAPHVAGACAVLCLIDENSSPSEIKNTLFEYHCETPDNWLSQYGVGKLSFKFSDSGTFGDGFLWNYTSGVLTLTGDGVLPEFDNPESIPWKNYMDTVKMISLLGNVDGFSLDKLGEFPMLREIKINSENTHYCSIDGVVYTKDKKTLIACPPLCVKGEYEVPEGTVTIAENAFKNCHDITSVVIPASVTTLSSGTFSGCVSLSDIYYKGSTEKWGTVSKASGWDTNLGVNTYGKAHTVTCGYVSPDYMGKCGETAMWKVWQDSGVLRIEGKGATYDFNSFLENETSVTDAGWFDYKEYIKSIEIKDDITVLGENIFYLSVSCTEITLGKGVTTIKENAFDYTLSKLTLSESFERFEGAALKSAWYLSEVNVDENNSYFSSANGAVYTKDGTELVVYPSGKTDNEYVMPEGVKKIRNDVFNANRYVQKVTFCEGFEEIGDRAFKSCYIPFEIVFPDSLKSIGESAFEDVSGLMFTGLPEGFENLGNRAFAYCQSLQYITIPLSTAKIGSEAFYNCTAMTKIYYAGSSTQWNLIDKASDWNKMWAGNTIVFDTVRPGGMYDDSGSLGSSSYWYYWSEEGLLIIKGTGTTSARPALTDNYKATVKTVVVEEGITSIGNSLFYGFLNMESVELPESVTAIGTSAFQNCQALKEINIPSKLKSIGEFAFYWCQSVKSIHLPVGITSIPRYAFSDCYSLESINIPTGVTSIGENAFSDCVLLNNIILPSTVTKLDYRAFYNCEFMDSIQLSEGLKTIDANAFESCGSLENLKMPESVVSIGDNAFLDCTILKPFILPKNLESIANTVFRGTSVNEFMVHPESTKLKTVDGVLYDYDLTKLVAYPISKGDSVYTVPLGVTQIGDGAFQYCINLQKVIFADKVSHIPTGAFRYCKNLQSVEVSGVETIGEYAFGDCTALTDMINQDKLISIGDQAFINCKSLSEVSLKNSVKTVGVKAFYGCSGLKKLTIGTSVESIGSHAFDFCRYLEIIIVYRGTRTIADDAFSGSYSGMIFHTGTKEEWWANPINVNTSYATIIHNYDPIGDSVYGSCNETVNWHLSFATGKLTIDGSGAMSDYTSTSLAPWNYPELVKSIEVCENITSLGNYSFYKLSSVSEISLPETLEKTGKYSLYGCSKIEKLTVPSKITVIDEGAFGSMGALAEVNLPQNLMKISAKGFTGCSALTEIDLPQGLTTLGANAFSYCRSLTEITIPDGVKTLEEGVFLFCSALKRVNFPENLEVIGNQAFSYCNLLEITEFPSKLQKIGDKAFLDSFVGEKIEFPDTLTIIGAQAFDGCDEIKLVIFNNGLSWIKTDAFGTREDIAGYFNGTVEEWNEISDAKYLDFEVCVAFDGENYAEDFGTYQNYQWQIYDNGTTLKIVGEKTFNSTFISKYAGYAKTVKTIVLDDRITEIPGGAFKNFTALETYTVPERISSLGTSVFSGCTSLTSVDMYAMSISSVPQNTFQNCHKLTEVILPSKCTSIGSRAFQSCNNLKKLTMSSKLTSIDSYAFSRCSSLADVSFLTGVYSLSPNAFEYCTSITSVELYSFLAYLPDNLFYCCRNIVSVKLPIQLSRIGNSAFYSCDKLSSIELPEMVTKIGNSAFYGCYSLTQVTLPDAVQTLGNQVFGDCYNLTRVDVPLSLTSFGTDIFLMAENAVCYYPGTRDEWNNITNSSQIPASRVVFTLYPGSGSGSGSEEIKEVSWSYESGKKRLTISQNGDMPDWTYENYQDIPWREHIGAINEIVIGPNVTHIGAYTFYECYDVTRISVSSKNTTFKVTDGVLYKMEKDMPVELVKYLGTNTAEVFTIPDGVKKIHVGALREIGALKELYLPDSVEYIADNAVENCTALTSVMLGASLKEISRYAFYECGSLETIIYNGSEKDWNSVVKDKHWDYNMGFANKNGTQIIFAYGSEPGEDDSYIDENDSKSIICHADGKNVTVHVDSQNNNYPGTVIVAFFNKDTLSTMTTYDADSADHVYSLDGNGDNVRVFWVFGENLKPLCTGEKIDY